MYIYKGKQSSALQKVFMEMPDYSSNYSKTKISISICLWVAMLH